MNSKAAKRIRQAIKNLPAMSETVTVTEWVRFEDLTKEEIEKRPDYFKPKHKYQFKVSKTQPINHEHNAKKAFDMGGYDAVAKYVKDMELAYAELEKQNKKASAQPGILETANRDHSII